MKFPKPLISAMNTHPTIVQRLLEAGYNAQEGTFGNCYVGEGNHNIQPLWNSDKLPKHFYESEIVVIDLESAHIIPFRYEKKVLDSDGYEIPVKAPYGVVDPRPFTMFQVKEKLDRIFYNGGVFIVFAAPETEMVIYQEYDSQAYKVDFTLSNWEFLTILQSIFRAIPDEGTQIHVTKSRSLLDQTLRRYCSSARFTATLQARDHSEVKWVSLATNKFGQTVAGVLYPSNDEWGTILIFPHVDDKAGFILEIIQSVLPEICPHLFPFIDETKWVSQNVYQPNSIMALRNEIHYIQESADKKIQELQAQIEAEQVAQQYLTDLLTQTDQSLVSAVKKSLEMLGFKDVLNYDEELEKRGVTEMREDLHIRDRSPLVLIEVKGVKGTSTEDEALQVTKYLFPRAKELGRNDLHGLLIINHQRYLPPLERRLQPFSDDVLTNAKHPDLGFGLLTTWNLYKLVRNFVKHGWTHDQVAEVFYGKGFLNAVPHHYKFVGTVERFIEKIGVVGILVKEGHLKVGDRIAFELTIEFEEQVVNSLQIENKSVESVQAEQLAGIQTSLTKDQLRTGVRVFRVEQKLNS